MLAICLVVVVVGLLWYLTDPFYWKRRNVPYLTPLPLFGNLLPSINYGMVVFMKQLHNKMPGHRYFGLHFLMRPALYVKDVKLVQRILVTDFEHFISHGFYSNEETDPAANNVFLSRGQQWREIRLKLNHYFTPVKLKTMLSYIDKAFNKLMEAFDERIEKSNGIVDVYTLISNATTHTITQSIFGVESDAFENPDSIFTKLSRNVFTATFNFKLYLGMMNSKIYDYFKLNTFDKELIMLIRTMVEKTMKYRKTEKIYIQDFLQGMMELMELDCNKQVQYFPDKTRVPHFNLDTVVAQSAILFIGGVETTTLAMIFFLYEVSKRPEIQARCRAEIEAVVSKGKPITVDDLSRLVYLSAAVQETMRIHSSFFLLTRECTKEYKVPDDDLIIEPGTLIVTSPTGFHLDEENYPEPEVFRPERFLNEENNAMISGTYMPFSQGPRSCIGMTYAQNQIRLLLARLLQHYEFYVCPKTQIPIKYGKFLFFAAPAERLWLGVKRL